MSGPREVAAGGSIGQPTATGRASFERTAAAAVPIGATAPAVVGVFLDLLAQRSQPGGIVPIAGANRASVGIILTNFQIGGEMNSTGGADED